jgi:hypothetical protein
MRPAIDNEKKLKIRNFLMNDSDRDIFKAHFTERKIPAGTGSE